MDQLHRYYPREALFVTELEPRPTGPGLIDEKLACSTSRTTSCSTTDVYDAKPFINGAIV